MLCMPCLLLSNTPACSYDARGSLLVSCGEDACLSMETFIRKCRFLDRNVHRRLMVQCALIKIGHGDQLRHIVFTCYHCKVQCVFTDDGQVVLA